MRARVMTRSSKVLLELNPHGVVDYLAGDALDFERGERRLFTAAEADKLLALTFEGRSVFARVEADTANAADDTDPED